MLATSPWTRARVERSKRELKEAKTQCAKLLELPENQRLAVRACFNASKIEDQKGIRYTTQWIYECLLLRIKSRKTYNHLRTHNILCLPSWETLNRYLKHLKELMNLMEI
ncbi:hypothetical protein TSAR_000280 [Trichomalopsis sarcophagae]|uniref:Uncharacterized protein n=1 Tax=Trichomalopsis sarcophagae TaxID=543379 RepID=A0A232EP93_9HYME|nr:hypothetical protein TSAR_000280 [Trichomalopsis sarcophagae]